MKNKHQLLLFTTHIKSIWYMLGNLSYKALVFCAFCIPSVVLYGQNDSYSFNQITVEDGLPGASINSLVQDSVGYLWFSTSNGVARFDGYDIKIYQYDEEELNTIPSNTCYILHVDGKGRVWAGTQEGLGLYDQGQDVFHRLYMPEIDSVDKRTANAFFNTIASDNHGRPVFVTEGGMIAGYDEQNNKLILLLDEVIKYIPKAAFFDSKNRLWIGTRANGLVKVSLENKKVTYYDSGFDYAEIWNFVEVNNELWMGTLGDGMYSFNPRTEKTKRLVIDGINGSHISSLLKKDNVVWIGSAQGLYAYNVTNNKINFYNNNKFIQTSLGDNSVRSIAFDNQNNLWVGHIKGVSYASNVNSFRYFNNITSGIATPIRSINIDDSGRCWMGLSDNSLMIFDAVEGKLVKQYHQDNSNGVIGNSDILEICITRNNEVFLGTYASGLIRYIPHKDAFIEYDHVPYNAKYNKKGLDARSITEDPDGNLWMIFHGYGFCKFNPKTEEFTNFIVSDKDFNLLSEFWMYSVRVDERGMVWFASPSGLVRFNPHSYTFKYYINDENDTTSISNNITDGGLFIDDYSNVWVGTRLGLNVLPKGSDKFIRILEKDGLAGMKLSSVIGDDQHNIWVAHDKGLSKIEIEHSGVLRKENIRKIKNFSKDDGLGTSTYFVESAAKDQQGRLYFGGDDALTVFDPAKITENTTIPEVHFTDFQISYEPVKVLSREEQKKQKAKGFYLEQHIDKLNRIELSYNQNVLTFKYVAINYINSQNNQYAYYMDGFDDNWHYVGTKREAIYTNLSPGTYTFKVKASNNDGYWNEQGRSLTITVNPPWWQTWWFRVLALLIAIYIVYVIIDARQKKNKHDKEILEAEIKKGEKIIEDKVAEVEKQKEEIRLRDIQEQEIRFQNNGLAKFSKLLAEQNEDIKQLTTSTITVLVEYVGANQGAIYLLNNLNDERHFLEITGSFAVNEEKLSQKEFEIDEGYIGVSFKDAETTTVNNLPDGFSSKISSGLGENQPRFLALVPIKQKDLKVGVIEIASFAQLEAYKIEFLEKIAENLASVIAVAKANQRSAIALEKANMQAEELMAQEEEIRQNLEEMQATEETYQRQVQDLNKTIDDFKKQIKKLENNLEEKDKIIAELTKDQD